MTLINVSRSSEQYAKYVTATININSNIGNFKKKLLVPIEVINGFVKVSHYEIYKKFKEGGAFDNHGKRMAYRATFASVNVLGHTVQVL